MPFGRIVGVAIACTAFAQDLPSTFDVATIRPSKPAAGMNNLRDPVQATWTNMPLAVVIQEAYDIRPGQLLGGSGWVYSDRWDIVAKTDRPATRDKQHHMLRSLLAERFQLKVHMETRKLPKYELVVLQDGPGS